MKLRSPVPHKKIRLEIIPLIDIMFFLLACFMLVSLSMIQMHGMKVNLPTTKSGSAHEEGLTTITIAADDTISIEGKPILSVDELDAQLKNPLKPVNSVYIRGDTKASYGQVVLVLDTVRSAGIVTAALETRPGGKFD